MSNKKLVKWEVTERESKGAAYRVHATSGVNTYVCTVCSSVQANLISAAPDLFESCEEMLQIIEEARKVGLFQGSEYINKVNKAKETVNKARGNGIYFYLYP